jgi:hypothetical protein
MTGIIPDEEEQRARILSDKMTRSVGAILDDRGSIGPGFDALPLDAYAQAICHVGSDAAAYRALQIAAGDAFDVRFNWRAWGAAVEHEIVRMKGLI